MRTAQALVPLDAGERPHSHTALVKATEAFTILASTAPETDPRFAGFQPSAAGQRVAVYEADYPHA